SRRGRDPARDDRRPAAEDQHPRDLGRRPRVPVPAGRPVRETDLQDGRPLIPGEMRTGVTMASLTIVVDGVEQKVPLEAAAVTLGRGLESDIRLKDIKASRRHCQVVKTAKGYQCVDLSSGNGTYVNGVQIKQQMLEPGDKITIGSTTIVFDDAPKA